MTLIVSATECDVCVCVCVCESARTHARTHAPTDTNVSLCSLFACNVYRLVTPAVERVQAATHRQMAAAAAASRS